MSNTILIIGESGSGKSTSIRTLDPKTTFIINCINKPLPFKGFKKLYIPITSWNDKEGNYYNSDDWSKIIKCIIMVNEIRLDITTLIIDDWQYILSYEFIRRSSEKGYDKYSEMAHHGWSTINSCMGTRDTLTNFIISHSDKDSSNRSKCKTIGKMLDEKITIEGLFTTVLHARVLDGKYIFQTQCDNDFLAKSPIDMFNDLLIPNDLLTVKNSIESYYNDDKE